MPLMPMPPMPTKCTGPMSRGSFMRLSPRSLRAYRMSRTLVTSTAAKSNPRHLHHQIGQPLGGVERAGGFGGRGHRGKPRGSRGERGDFGGQPFRREIGAASMRMAPPASSSTPALASWS